MSCRRAEALPSKRCKQTMIDTCLSSSKLGNKQDGPMWQPAHTGCRNAGRGQCVRSPGEGSVLIMSWASSRRISGHLGHADRDRVSGCQLVCSDFHGPLPLATRSPFAVRLVLLPCTSVCPSATLQARHTQDAPCPPRPAFTAERYPRNVRIA
jgi:hypothetical protein